MELHWHDKNTALGGNPVSVRLYEHKSRME